jgi:hypothetical protein
MNSNSNFTVAMRGEAASTTVAIMCYLDIKYCLACREVIHRRLETCSSAKERYICVDPDNYDDTNIVIMTRDSLLAIDLTKFMMQRRRDGTCQRCYDLGAEESHRNRRKEYYGEQGYYSD